MLSIPWWGWALADGWVALAVGIVIVAGGVWREIAEDRALRRKTREDAAESGDAADEIAPPVAKSNVGERRVPRYEIEREADGRVIAEDTAVPGAMAYGATAAEAKRKVERIAASAHVKPRSRKEAPTRKAKKARGRR